jgi:hypothetical protein
VEYLLVAVMLAGLVAIGGCDEGPQTFESDQAVCKSVGDCHVKQMPYQLTQPEHNTKNN